MKPSQWALIAALIGVGVIAFLMMSETGVERTPDQRRATERTDNRAGALDLEPTRTTDPGRDMIAIRGRVRGASGATVEALQVSERSAFDITSVMDAMLSPETVVARARVGRDGGYELHVPAGRLLALRAFADGYGQESEQARRYPNDVSGIDFYLVRGVQVAGVVVNRKGQAIAAAHVLLVDMRGPFEERAVKRETISDGNGRFALSTTLAENPDLVVRAAGYATYMSAGLTLPAPDLRIALQRGVSLRLRTVEAGTSGAPAPGVNVGVWLRGGLATGKTNRSGELLMGNLANEGSALIGDQQMVVLWGDGWATRTKSLEELEPTDGVLEVGEVEMRRGGTIRGRVLDATTGNGIAGATLQSVGGLREELAIVGGARTVSGADGRFELAGVPARAHTLIVLHPDYIGSPDQEAMDSAFDGSGGGEPIIPADRTSAQRDVKLQPAATLVGHVRGPDGIPVPGAIVTLQDEMAMFHGMMGGHAPTAVSDAEGKFILGGLRPGEVIQVVATHRDFGRSKMLSVAPGKPFEIRLTEPLLLHGVVVNEAGEPVGGARVTVAPQEDESEIAVSRATGQVRPCMTDAKGHFMIRNAPPGALEVTWDHRDYAPQMRRIDIVPGTSDHDLGRAVLRRGQSIEGEVVDADGNPVPNVAVHVYFERLAGWDQPELSANGTVLAPGRRFAQGRTDATGHFAIRGLRDGKYGVEAWRIGSYSAGATVTAGTKDVRIKLVPAGTLNGRVMSGGKPVANAWVRVRHRSDTSASLETDQDGRFKLDRLPPHEVFEIKISHHGYLDLVVKDLRATKKLREFALDRGVHFGGLVTDPTGKPLAGVTVSIRVGNSGHSVQSQADGRFSAGGLGEGEIVVFLSASDDGYLSTNLLTVAPGDESILLIAVMGETIAGTVRDADGAPARHVMISVFDGDGTGVGGAWGDEGKFEIVGLPEGRYTVRAFGSKSQSSAEATGVATGTLDLQLTVR